MLVMLTASEVRMDLASRQST